MGVVASADIDEVLVRWSNNKTFNTAAHFFLKNAIRGLMAVAHTLKF
jgi:hypothetical protein